MKLSIFGPRGCGKTTYMTCLYGQGGKFGSFAIYAKNEATRNYLAERWYQLINGTEIAPTALGSVPLYLEFSANRQAYTIELQDFAGALVMRESKAKPDELKEKLKQALFKYFRESSGMMIFIEAGDADFRAQFERRLEVDALLEVLHESDRRALITCPIGIIITKWDKVTHDKKLDHAERAQRFIKENYGNLYALLQECAENVKIFPSSAYGFSLCGADGQMDFRKIQPFNLEQPFVWMGEMIDRSNYRRCELIEEDQSPQAALKHYQQFCAQVNAGPYYEQARQRMKQLRGQIRARQLRIYGIVGAALLLLLGLGGFAYEKHSNSAVHRLLDQVGSDKDPDQVIRKVENYLQSYHPLADLLGWKTPIKTKLADFQQQTERKSFAAIRALYEKRDQARNEASINSRIDSYRRFTAAYPLSPQKSEVVQWIQQESDDLRVRYGQRAYSELTGMRPARNKQELEAAIAKATQFLANYSDDRNQEQQQQVRQLLLRWQNSLAELSENDLYRQFLIHLAGKSDEYEYIRYCRSYIEQHPEVSFHRKIHDKIASKEKEIYDQACQTEISGSDFSAKVAGYIRYLKEKHLTTYRKDVEKNLRQMEDDLYQEMRKLNSPERITAERARQIEQAARHYIKSAYFGTKARDVGKWLEWYERAQRPITFTVLIKSAKLGKDGGLFSGVSYPDTQVFLDYGQETFKTITVTDDWNPTYNTSCRLEWSLSHSHSLQLRIVCYDWSNQTKNWASPDSFLPKYINSDVVINAGITIHLRCNDLLWPELP